MVVLALEEFSTVQALETERLVREILAVLVHSGPLAEVAVPVV
jgi:hypothetical protein